MFREKFTESEGTGYQVTWEEHGEFVSYETSKPKEALEKWVKEQKNNSLTVEITSMTKKDIKVFYEWIYNNTEEFTKIINKQKAYKTRHLYTESHAVNYKNIQPDEGMHPFTVG